MSDDANPLPVFGAYAAAFEETYKDDDWSRLLPFFSDGAVYSVVNLGPSTCSIRGPEAIVAGLRKSVDGFDRRLGSRAIEVVAGPDVNGSNVRVDWRATYTVPDGPDLSFTAYSVGRIADGKIVELFDVYDPGAVEALAEWRAASGMDVDPSYV